MQSFKHYNYVTVFRKINWSARKPIIAYMRKYAFEHEDANEKDAHFNRRRNVGFASNLDVKGNKAIKSEICFSR